MMYITYLLLLSSSLNIVVCHPADDLIKLPEINISNPYEINNLNYYNAEDDADIGESKLFRRTVNNFEKSVSYIDKTVREVEALINANSTLPRLTRGEILEIIENITQSNTTNAKSNQTKVRDQKAVMLVMPYTPQNADDEKMQELFTKKPVTRIVDEKNKRNESEVKVTQKRRRRPLPQVPERGAFFGEVFPEPLPHITTEKTPIKKPTSFANKEKSTPKPMPVYTQVSLTEKPFTIEASKSSFSKYEPEIITDKPLLDEPSTEIRQPSVSTEMSVNSNTHTNISVRRRRPSKSPHRHANHKYPDETVLKQGINIANPSKLKLETYSTPTIAKVTEFTTQKQVAFTLPTSQFPTPSQPHYFTTSKPVLPNVPLPDDLKTTLDELELGESVPKLPSGFNPPYDSETGILSNPPPLNDNVRDLLASIGVLPSTSTTAPVPDISNVADTLTPDMKQLLMNFGLLPNPNSKPEEVKEDQVFGVSTAEIHPDSYVQFKPLPDSGPTRDEMEEFLGRFGLGKNTKSPRNQKALSVKEPEQPLSEIPSIAEGMVPDSMKSVLSNLGLTNRGSKKIRVGSVNKISDKHSAGEKQKETSFNETQYASEEELEKLNQLLDIIKQLEKLNRTATAEDLNKIDLKNLKDIMGTFNKEEFLSLDDQEWGPNPLNDDIGVNKNEVKRQQNFSAAVAIEVEVSSASPVSSTTTAATTTTTTTTTTEAPNIKDLADSFGGPSDTQPEATIPPPTTKTPDTGFYYLLDWNTFLDIDDQKGKRVNLRFQPKAGDPRKFISVTVP